MKIFYIVLAILMLLLLSGCENKKEQTYQETQSKISETIVNIENVTEEKIKESYLYIKNNYQNTTSKDTNQKLMEKTSYLELVTKNNRNSKLYELATKNKEYLTTSKKDLISEIKKILNSIENNEDKIINEAFVNYHKAITIEKIIKTQTIKASADANDKNMITKTNIKNAIMYLTNNIANPLKNDEILEKTIYYSLFLSNLSKNDSELKNLGDKSLSYIKTLDQNELNDLMNLINKINKNQDKIVTDFYNSVKK